jgi:DNA-directed RNA polymerase specialized sigma24 family protein
MLFIVYNYDELHDRGSPLRRLNQDQALEFYNREYPVLFRYVLYLCSEKDLAEEICQETFLRWFRLNNQEDVEFPRPG